MNDPRESCRDFFFIPNPRREGKYSEEKDAKRNTISKQPPSENRNNHFRHIERLCETQENQRVEQTIRSLVLVLVFLEFDSVGSDALTGIGFDDLNLCPSKKK